MDPGPVYETCQRVRRMEPYVSSWMPRFVNNFLELSTWAILEKYNHAHFWYPPLFLAVNHHNIENWVPFILTHNLWLISMGMKQKRSFFNCQFSMFFCENIENWQSWKMTFFWVGHFEFFFAKKKKIFFCFIPMKISHKLHVRVDGTQFLLLWWFTAKNESGNHKWA